MPHALAHGQGHHPPFCDHTASSYDVLTRQAGSEEEDSPSVNGIWETIFIAYLAEYGECGLGGSFYCELFFGRGYSFLGKQLK